VLASCCRKACQRYGIACLFIFGCALREDFRHGDSDIDLLAGYGPLEISKEFHAFLEARAAFSMILQAEVDFVMRGAVKNNVIASEINRKK